MKKTATKAIAAGLAVITLAAGMIGCDDNTNKPADTTAAKSETAVATESATDAVTTVADVTTESETPVEEDITADEVLALYDEFAHAIVKGAYSSEYNRELLGDQYNRLTGEFLTISTNSSFISNDEGNIVEHKHPFYSIYENFKPSSSWNNSPDTLFYIENMPTFNNTVYAITLNVNSIDIKDNIPFKETYSYTGISKESMEELLNTFEKKEIIITDEHITDAPNCKYCSCMVGETVYEPMDITRETIQNSTPAQLSALKDVLNSMIAINIYGEYPEPGKTYEIILE